MSELETVVKTTLAQAEEFSLEAIDRSFADAVETGKKADLKPRKGGKGGKKTAAIKKFHEEQAAKAVEKPVTATATPVVSERPADLPPENLFEGVDALLFGADYPDFLEVQRLRTEGFDKLARAKAMNVFDLELKLKQKIWQLKYDQVKEVERMLYNNYANMGKTGEIQKTAFKQLEQAYHDWNGDPFQKMAFEEMCLVVINRYPRMKLLHEENLARAEVAQQEFDELKAQHDELRLEGEIQLEDANKIASKHGWPTTEAKKKEANSGKKTK
jgi:hypothetical protein